MNQESLILQWLLVKYLQVLVRQWYGRVLRSWMNIDFWGQKSKKQYVMCFPSTSILLVVLNKSNKAFPQALLDAWGHPNLIWIANCLFLWWLSRHGIVAANNRILFYQDNCQLTILQHLEELTERNCFLIYHVHVICRLTTWKIINLRTSHCRLTALIWGKWITCHGNN